MNCEPKYVNSRKQNNELGRSLLPTVACDLLKEVEQIFQKHGDLTDDALLALHSLFGSPLEKALELLETNRIAYFRAPGGRYVIQVIGSSGAPYTLFPKVNYCPCHVYRFQVVGSQTFLTCKHVLAARLAEIVGKGRELSVTDMEITRILCTAANLDGENKIISP